MELPKKPPTVGDSGRVIAQSSPVSVTAPPGFIGTIVEESAGYYVLEEPTDQKRRFLATKTDVRSVQ